MLNSSSICGIKEWCEFLVSNSSRQIAGLPRHRPLQGSRQPALISKGGVKEKSLLYPHTVPYIPLSLPYSHHQSTSRLCSPHSLQHGGVHMHVHLSECVHVFVCNVCTQQQRIVPVRSKWRANGEPQIKARPGDGENKRREDDDGGAGGNRKERQTNHLTKEVGGGVEGRGMCCKVWTAQHHDSLGVIMIEWSLIDCLSLQDLQSTSVLWMKPLWHCLASFMWTSAGLLFPAAWFMSVGALFWPGQACSPNHQVWLKTVALSTINELKKQRATTTATSSLILSF